MKKIWKHNIDLGMLDKDSRIVLMLPVGAKIVHVGQSLTESFWDFNDGMANSETYVTIWFEFEHSYGDAARPTTSSREIYVFGTDHPIPDYLQHRGTKVGKLFVWHVYERAR